MEVDEDEEVVEEDVKDDFEHIVCDRDPQTNEVLAVRIRDEYSGSSQHVIRRYSTVMLQADAGTPPFIGLIREFDQDPDDPDADIVATVAWFYRANDLKVKKPADLVVRRARLSDIRGGGDKGSYQELFFSNHTDKVSCLTIMHPVKVWCLPDDSLEPVLLQPTPSAVPAPVATSAVGMPAAVAARTALLPGFICRRLYEVVAARLTPLGKVPQRKGLDPWVVPTVAEMLKRSAAERQAFMVEWRQRCAARLVGGIARLKTSPSEEVVDDELVDEEG